MYEYELELEICAIKHLVIKANSEEDALDMAADILETEVIPIEPEDMPDINVNDIYKLQRN